MKDFSETLNQIQIGVLGYLIFNNMKANEKYELKNNGGDWQVHKVETWDPITLAKNCGYREEGVKYVNCTHKKAVLGCCQEDCPLKI